MPGGIRLAQADDYMKRNPSFILILVIASLLGSSAFAKKNRDCDSKFLKKSERYVDESELPGNLREPVLAARKRVEKKLGRLPVIRRIDLTELNDVRLFEKGVATKSENAIAHTSFKVNGNVLRMGMTWVVDDENYRHKGLSELMLAEILAAHPEVDRIYVNDLTDTNLELYQESRKTMGIKDAIRQTYGYMSYARFGFTKIVDPEDFPGKFIPMTFGKKKYSFVEEEPHVSFTVKRP